MFTPVADLIDHSAPRPADPAPGATIEYGKYLSAICLNCHSANLAGRLKNWTQEVFIRTMRTGALPNGRQLGLAMPPAIFGSMSDTELTALWLYLQSLP